MLENKGLTTKMKDCFKSTKQAGQMPGIFSECKILREAELGVLLKHLEKVNLRGYLMVYLASVAGLRLTEACCMRIEDFVKYRNREILIRVAKKTTGKPSARQLEFKALKAKLLAQGREQKARRVVYRSRYNERPLWPHFISPKTVLVLDRCFKELKINPARQAGWLFPGHAPDGHALEADVHNWFGKVTKKVGIGRKTFHCLRHYRGFTVQRLKGDLTITKDELRHSSVAITQMYVRRTADERKQLADELDS